MSRSRARAVALLVVLAVSLGAAALYTPLGVLLVGYRYWLWRASCAESEDALRENLGRVLSATQYGVNQAEGYVYVREIEDQRLRIRMWRTLIDMAPNDNWVQHYTRDLESELSPPAGPQRP